MSDIDGSDYINRIHIKRKKLRCSKSGKRPSKCNAIFIFGILLGFPIGFIIGGIIGVLL